MAAQPLGAGKHVWDREVLGFGWLVLSLVLGDLRLGLDWNAADLDRMGSLSYCPFLGWLVQVRSFPDGGGCLLLYAHYLHIRYGHEVGVHH